MNARALLLSTVISLPGTLQAQDAPTDSLPFHAGQWAAQFTGGASFASLGVLKFGAPTRALVLDVSLSGSHREHFTGDTLAGIDSQASLDLRLGRRWYRPVADKVVALHSFGIQTGYSHFVTTSPFSRLSQEGWDVGPFAELGAVYLITPHFGIGATGTAFITYMRLSGESSLGTKTRTWSLGGGTSVRFAATLFF